ncbi:MAG TPA: hypothetical protein VF180_07580 [Acidimicrobiia bacterium]
MAKRSARNEQIERLFALLDRLEGDATVVASVRQPAALREAVKVAVELGLDPTPNDAAVAALRERVETFAQRLALDAHYAAHPGARPTLAQRALAAARLDGDPLADDPALLSRAAEALARRRPDASADDVLLYATGLADARASA